MEKKQLDIINSPIGKKVFVAAHRGRFGGCIPENTLAAFDAAIGSGADIVETDIAKLADGTFILFHDTDAERMLGVKRPITSFTYEELKGYTLKNSIGEPSEFHINTLDELLEHLKGRCYINLDKCDGYLDEVFQRVVYYGMEEQILLKNHVVCKGDLDWMERTGYRPIYIPVLKKDEDAEALYELIKRIDVQIVEVFLAVEDSALISREFVEDMHTRGIKIWVNALDLGNNLRLNASRGDNRSLLVSPDEGWGWYVKRGVDIIQTDWVMETVNYLDAIGRR